GRCPGLCCPTPSGSRTAAGHGGASGFQPEGMGQHSPGQRPGEAPHELPQPFGLGRCVTHGRPPPTPDRGASPMSTRDAADRRDFLKATAAAGAVTLAGLSPGAFAAEGDRIRVGLIGCGGRGTGAVRNILDADEVMNGQAPKVDIVAVGDVFKSQAEDAVKTFQGFNYDQKAKAWVKNPKSSYLKHAAQIKVTPETTFDGLD